MPELKITLFSAISVDGYIAKSNKDSEWVLESINKALNDMCQEVGVVIVGRKTFNQYYKDVFPIKGVINVVLTTEINMPIEYTNIKSVNSVQQAVDYLQSHQIKQAIMAGGGTLNASFLRENKINELIVVVHPLILGAGVKLFENIELEKHLEFLGSVELGEGLVQLHYNVLN